MPLGALLDQWEIEKQFHGMSKAKVDYFIEDLVRLGAKKNLRVLYCVIDTHSLVSKF